MDNPTITPEDIETLNAARTVLDRISHDFYYNVDTQASGIVFARAEVAAEAIFALLNYAHAHGDLDITADELHNRS